MNDVKSWWVSAKNKERWGMEEWGMSGCNMSEWIKKIRRVEEWKNDGWFKENMSEWIKK